MLKQQLKVKIHEEKEGKEVPVNVFIRKESYGVLQKLKTQYAQNCRTLIKMGVATKSSMLDLLKKEGHWNEEQESNLNQLTIKAALLESLLESTPDDAAKQKETVIELTKVRNELFELVQIKTEPMAYVAESIAEEIMQENYLVESTFYEDGRRYFKDYDDFKERRESEGVSRLYGRFLEELNTRNSEFFMSLPENKWLVKNGIIRKSGEFINEELKKEILQAPQVVSPVEPKQEAEPVPVQPS